jgi:hypothetical protein
VKWIAIDAYHWRRECGRYFVDRAVVPTSKTGERFCAWFKQHDGAIAELLGCFDSQREGVGRCASHLRGEMAPVRSNNVLPTSQAQLAL